MNNQQQYLDFNYRNYLRNRQQVQQIIRQKQKSPQFIDCRIQFIQSQDIFQVQNNEENNIQNIPVVQDIIQIKNINQQQNVPKKQLQLNQDNKIDDEDNQNKQNDKNNNQNNKKNNNLNGESQEILKNLDLEQNNQIKNDDQSKIEDIKNISQKQIQQNDSALYFNKKQYIEQDSIDIKTLSNFKKQISIIINNIRITLKKQNKIFQQNADILVMPFNKSFGLKYFPTYKIYKKQKQIDFKKQIKMKIQNKESLYFPCTSSITKFSIYFFVELNFRQSIKPIVGSILKIFTQESNKSDRKQEFSQLKLIMPYLSEANDVADEISQMIISQIFSYFEKKRNIPGQFIICVQNDKKFNSLSKYFRGKVDKKIKQEDVNE